MENAPLLSAVAVPKEEEPLNNVTVELASAVPVIVGVESLVEEEVDKDVGASGAVESGAVESIVMERAEEESDVLPALSVAVVVNE